MDHLIFSLRSTFVGAMELTKLFTKVDWFPERTSVIPSLVILELVVIEHIFKE